ncbi:MAG: spore coat protein CotJB [Defluviitaleaceae bacterium]|nr:spore coat protein CotJB [Defluviitaleaceae bacterium]
MFSNEFYKESDDDCRDRVPVMKFDGFGKAYIPFQELCEVYSENMGFIRGTIFPELDMPYEPKNDPKRLLTQLERHRLNREKNPPPSRNKGMGHNVESMSHVDRRNQLLKREENRYNVKALNENINHMDCDNMLQKISALDFMLLEISLYLDINPTDQNAILIHKQVSNDAKKIRESYEENFGPLSNRDLSATNDEWKWIQNPWPWDNEANFKIREV